MPKMVTVYDLVDNQTLNMPAISANEAVKNDPKRYSLEAPSNEAAKPAAPKKAEKKADD